MLPVRDVRQSFVYCDPCHGIPPTLVTAPRDFFTGQMLVLVAAVIVLLIRACFAQELLAAPAIESAQSPSRQTVIIPGTDYEVLVGATELEPDGTGPKRDLLRAIVFWLSRTFELRSHDMLPRIEFAAASKITALRYKDLLGNRPDGLVAAPPAGQREVVAIYDNQTMSIVLPDGWTGSSPAELSVLVHELVHHLQNLGGLKFACPQEREKLAYVAQQRWLNLFGRDLLRDFEIDPFTLVATTSCYS
jgi:hypothetical protein